jgi:hypothetical protein
VIHALLRTKAFEPSTLPHKSELAIAVSAMVIHGFLPNGVASFPNGVASSRMASGPNPTPLRRQPRLEALIQLELAGTR